MSHFDRFLEKFNLGSFFQNALFRSFPIRRVAAFRAGRIAKKVAAASRRCSFPMQMREIRTNYWMDAFAWASATFSVAQVSKLAVPRISHPRALPLAQSCRLGRRRQGGLGMSEKRAFWKNKPKLNFFKNRSKWLIDNHLRTETEVVKKRQLEKQTQIGLSPNEPEKSIGMAAKERKEPKDKALLEK